MKVTSAPRPTPVPNNGTATVSVACKIPNGLFLELGTPGAPDYRSQVINGSHHKSSICGFGITEGVDEAFIDAWLEKNRALSFVREELIFKQANAMNAQAAALDSAHLKSGLEALSPDAMPKGVTPESRDEAA